MIGSMCKKCSWCNVDTGILILRIGVGFIFIMAGWEKVSNLEGTVAAFATMGFSPFWTYVASFTELLGGIAVLLGIYTKDASVLLAITMAVATYVTRSNQMTMMTPLSFLFSTIALSFMGGGKYVVKKEECACGSCESCKVPNTPN